MDLRLQVGSAVTALGGAWVIVWSCYALFHRHGIYARRGGFFKTGLAGAELDRQGTADVKRNAIIGRRGLPFAILLFVVGLIICFV